MKILWIDPLNTEAQALNVMAAVLRDAGHDVHVRSIRRAGFDPPPGVDWTPFVRLPAPARPFRADRPALARLAASYPFGWMRALRQARARGAGATLVTTSLALRRWDTWALRRLRRCGVAPVVIVHRPYMEAPRDPEGRRAPRYGAFYRQAARILTMNRRTRDWMRTAYALPEDRLLPLRLPHFGPLLDGFPTDRGLARRLAEWAGGAPVVAFLSNMRPEQGLDDLLSALPILDAELPDWRLLVVSSGGSRRKVAAVEARLAALGFGDRVRRRWDPYSYPELKAFLGAASLVTTPYRWAAQSGVVAMAAGAGLPAVSTDTGGLPEIVRSGVNGELVPVGDPARLARAIAGVVRGLDCYRRGAEECRDSLFAPRRAADDIAAALRAAAGDGSR